MFAHGKAIQCDSGELRRPREAVPERRGDSYVVDTDSTAEHSLPTRYNTCICGSESVYLPSGAQRDVNVRLRMRASAAVMKQLRYKCFDNSHLEAGMLMETGISHPFSISFTNEILS